MSQDTVPAYAADYEHLRFTHDDGITLITIDRPERYNATNARLHWELGQVWIDIAKDPATRAAVVTGAGKAFSAGGDLELVREQMGNFEKIANLTKEARDIVLNMMECEKVIVSAINGVAVGAGLAVALMADISVAARSARLTDGHLRLGVGAGDHAVILWPLLCGMAKAKYYLLTSGFVGGEEAERVGLVSKCVDDDRVVDEAMEIARNIASGPQQSLSWTKRSLNLWLRQASPAFESSLAYEMLAFMGPDVPEGEQAIREKRPPRFPSAGAGA